MFDLCEIIKNASLTNYNTYHIKTECSYLAFPKNVNELTKLLDYLRSNKISYFIMGNGSNIILSDNKYNGVVVNLTKMKKLAIDENKNIIKATAGVMLPQIVKEAVNHNLQGLEWASGIPGTIGGSIYGNAGAYLSCIFDYLEEVTVYYKNEIKTLKKNEIIYGYRYTSFKEDKDYVILEATLKLSKGNKEDSLKIIKNRLERRQKSQPLQYPSAGSVFRNPSQEEPAGKLIEECNLKGLRIGGAEVSNIHANFIINKGNATGSDIKKLIKIIAQEVKLKYNISLICEQEIIEWND